jgi:hypothetical protein
MATANKILGTQACPSTTPASLYTVPGATQANANIYVANLAAVAKTFRLSLAKSGDSTEQTYQYLAYDMSIPANSSLNFTGISLGAGDKIRIYAQDANVAFTAVGIEIT